MGQPCAGVLRAMFPPPFSSAGMPEVFIQVGPEDLTAPDEAQGERWGSGGYSVRGLHTDLNYSFQNGVPTRKSLSGPFDDRHEAVVGSCDVLTDDLLDGIIAGRWRRLTLVLGHSTVIWPLDERRVRRATQRVLHATSEVASALAVPVTMGYGQFLHRYTVLLIARGLHGRVGPLTFLPQGGYEALDSFPWMWVGSHSETLLRPGAKSRYRVATDVAKVVVLDQVMGMLRTRLSALRGMVDPRWGLPRRLDLEGAVVARPRNMRAAVMEVEELRTLPLPNPTLTRRDCPGGPLEVLMLGEGTASVGVRLVAVVEASGTCPVMDASAHVLPALSFAALTLRDMVQVVAGVQRDMLPGATLGGAGRRWTQEGVPRVVEEVAQFKWCYSPMTLQAAHMAEDLGLFPTDALVGFYQACPSPYSLHLPGIPTLVFRAPNPPHQGMSGHYELHQPLPGMGDCGVEILGCEAAETSTYRVVGGPVQDYQAFFTQYLPSANTVQVVLVGWSAATGVVVVYGVRRPVVAPVAGRLRALAVADLPAELRSQWQACSLPVGPSPSDWHTLVGLPPPPPLPYAMLGSRWGPGPSGAMQYWRGCWGLFVTWCGFVGPPQGARGSRLGPGQLPPGWGGVDPEGGPGRMVAGG